MKTFIVNSGEWRDEVDINTELFDEYSSQCVEAMTLSLERWIENEDEFMIGPLCGAYGKDEGSSDNDYVMLTTAVFENLGRLDMVEYFANCDEL